SGPSFSAAGRVAAFLLRAMAFLLERQYRRPTLARKPKFRGQETGGGKRPGVLRRGLTTENGNGKGILQHNIRSIRRRGVVGAARLQRVPRVPRQHREPHRG